MNKFLLLVTVSVLALLAVACTPVRSVSLDAVSAQATAPAECLTPRMLTTPGALGSPAPANCAGLGGAVTAGQASNLRGVTQSRISDRMRARWEKFSLEWLVTLAARAGRQVTLELA